MIAKSLLSTVPTSPAVGHSTMLDKMLAEKQAMFDAVNQKAQQFGQYKALVEGLLDKGVAVQQDDVLNGMAEMVGHGADPKMLTQLMVGNPQGGLPPMPTSGEALSQWLQQIHQGVIEPMEEQLRPALALAQHDLGVAALHKLIESHARQMKATQGGASPEASPAGPLASPGLPSPNAPSSPTLM